MKNKVINIIRPINNAAEKEYLKEFFRFIGCFLSDLAVDEDMLNSWMRALRPSMEPGGIDIVLNYFGEDPYLMDCEMQGIMRIYCYFSFSDGYGYVTDTPLASVELAPKVDNNERILRRTVLRELIYMIWKYEPEALESVQRIAMLYMSTLNGQGDLFHHIQTRKSLRFLGMDDVLSEPNAHVSTIKCTPAVKNALVGLRRVWISLEPYGDAYSRYAQIKAARMIHDIAAKLPKTTTWALSIPSMEELVEKIQKLIDKNPEFLSAHLYMAGVCKYVDLMCDREESCYANILRLVPSESRYYAFIWYRLGKLIEKKYHDHWRAKEFYRKAVQVDSSYYQALFKLGHYAAIEARYDEAEMFLQRTLRSVFHIASTQYDGEKSFYTWQFLSPKEVQYVFKTYILLAQIAIKTNREYSARDFIGEACVAALVFERSTLVNCASTEVEFLNFWKCHRMSEPVWTMWKILERWTEDVIYDFHVRDVVREKLKQWVPKSDTMQEISTIQHKNRMGVEKWKTPAAVRKQLD